MVKPKYKDRYVAFYLPDDETLPRWKAFAETTEATTFSGFICSAVEDSIDRKNNPRPAVYVESRELLEENARLREELKRSNLTISKLEDDISRIETYANKSWDYVKELLGTYTDSQVAEELMADDAAYEKRMAFQTVAMKNVQQAGNKSVQQTGTKPSQEAGTVVKTKKSKEVNVDIIKLFTSRKNISNKELQEALKGDETAYEKLMALQKAGKVVETRTGWKVVKNENQL